MVALIALACYRFSLTGHGYFTWGDERYYLPAMDLVNDLIAGDFRSAAVRPFESLCRPTFVLVSTIPAAAQHVYGSLTGVDPTSLRYYDIPGAFNVLVSLGITTCLFGLGRIWTGSRWYALLIALVHALLCNSNMWIGHLMPYNQSLLFFLIALWIVSRGSVRESPSQTPVVTAGVLSALGLMCYPGLYASVAIVGAVAMFGARRPARAALTHIAAFACTVGSIESLARLSGESYIEDLLLVSGAATMGLFREGYVFLWRYLRDVEGVAGILLFILFLGFALLIVWRRDARLSRSTRIAMIAAVACYLAHATRGVVFEKMVFYGRTLLIYTPFVVGGAVLALMHFRQRHLRRVGVGVLVAASAWSFVTSARQFAGLTYPPEFFLETIAERGSQASFRPYVLWDVADGDERQALHGAPHPVELLGPEFAMVTDTRSGGSKNYVHLDSHEAARANEARFIGVNLKWMFHIRERHDRFEPPPGYDLVACAPHPFAQPAALYEGYKPWERKRFLERKYDMMIYERIADDG